MEPSPRHRQYWRRNLWLTGLLLLVWAAVTFVPVYWAQDLNRIVLFGWPLAYYMGAQGALIVYLLLIWVYAWAMDRLDRDCGVNEDGE